MTKFLKIILDTFELFQDFSMMLPCLVPFHHSGRSDVRCVGIHNELLTM